MFKTATVVDSTGLKVAKNIMARIYDENPKYWPHGLNAEGFDGGLYLVMEKQSNFPAGFVGLQNRIQYDKDHRLIKVGYYSIGILKSYRNNGFAKQAVAKLIALKAASVDCMKALIVSNNAPSIALANSLGVEVQLKKASAYTIGCLDVSGMLRASL